MNDLIASWGYPAAADSTGVPPLDLIAEWGFNWWQPVSGPVEFAAGHNRTTYRASHTRTDSEPSHDRTTFRRTG